MSKKSLFLIIFLGLINLSSPFLFSYQSRNPMVAQKQEMLEPQYFDNRFGFLLRPGRKAVVLSKEIPTFSRITHTYSLLDDEGIQRELELTSSQEAVISDVVREYKEARRLYFKKLLAYFASSPQDDSESARLSHWIAENRQEFEAKFVETIVPAQVNRLELLSSYYLSPFVGIAEVFDNIAKDNNFEFRKDIGLERQANIARLLVDDCRKFSTEELSIYKEVLNEQQFSVLESDVKTFSERYSAIPELLLGLSQLDFVEKVQLKSYSDIWEKEIEAILSPGGEIRCEVVSRKEKKYFNLLYSLLRPENTRKLELSEIQIFELEELQSEVIAFIKGIQQELASNGPNVQLTEAFEPVFQGKQAENIETRNREWQSRVEAILNEWQLEQLSELEKDVVSECFGPNFILLANRSASQINISAAQKSAIKNRFKEMEKRYRVFANKQFERIVDEILSDYSEQNADNLREAISPHSKFVVFPVGVFAYRFHNSK